MHTVLIAVASGIGISLVPGCVRSFRQPGVVLRPARPASPAIDLVFVRPKGEMSPTVAAWRELLVEQLPRIRRQMEGQD
jgi:DNA-binding transcriptional LysR family regulator